MEVAVVQDDGPRGVTVCDGQVVIEHELEGGVPRQVALHLDAAVDGGVDDVAWRVEEDVDFFVDVDEDVVVVALADGDWRGGGVDGVGTEKGEVADFFDVEQSRLAFADDFRCDKGFDVGGVGELGVSEIDDFV